MLETYFVKPQTVDRIRASWIGAEVERHVGWLAAQGYSVRSVLRRVPLLIEFGGFARLGGAVSLADLPGPVDGFVAWRGRRPRGARYSTGAAPAQDLPGPVGQRPALGVPGWEGAGARQ